MSDFLSNFNEENYKKTKQKKKQSAQPEANKSTAAEPIDTAAEATSQNAAESAEQTEINEKTETAADEKTKSEESKADVGEAADITTDSAKTTVTSETELLDREEMTENDPTYQQRKRNLFILGGIIAVVVCAILGFSYYQLTHIKVPDFEGKELSEAYEWTTEHKIKLNVEQKYNFDKEANIIVKQTVKNKKIKKGSELTIETSMGPDPEETIALPDFEKMKIDNAKSWIKEHKAENLTLIEEYSETVEAGSFIKLDITTKEVKPETYQRKNKAKLYFSKGKEVYEKDIAMPDLVGKSKEEANDWAKKNEITLKIEEVASDKTELGKVITQSVTKDTKIAKKETVTVSVSLGKALKVPDFAQYTAGEAEGKANGLSIQVKEVYNESVPYGHFISQSVESGREYTDKDDKPTIQIYYSIGQPYIKDLRGSTLEGELQKIFFDEYQSKGANITYQVYYVDSGAGKGTVVEMSKYNEFSPINAVIQIGISKGNLATTYKSPNNETKDNTDVDKEMESTEAEE
jgi:beta-lactam-binding protein with PASTA domain